MSNKPKIKDDELYRLLREGRIEEFNQRRAGGELADLTECDFRGLDLRGLNADGLDMRDSYFHQTDLRGVDLRGARLEGASLNMARISGAYFPVELRAEEISLSVNAGTRMRYQK